MEIGDYITLYDYDGEWRVIDSRCIDGVDYFLIESANDEDEYPQMIIDEDLNVVCDEADDGFDSLE